MDVGYSLADLQETQNSPLLHHAPLSMDEFLRQVADVTRRDMADDLAERRKRKVNGLMGRAAIPPRFADRTLDSYRADTREQARVLRVCQQYAAGFLTDAGAGKTGACLLLCGKPGTGKTHLAAGIAHVLLGNGGTAVYATAMQVVRAIRETWGRGNGGKTESQVLADFVRPDLLIMDEVGVQYGTDAEKVHLFDVINARYEEVKPTLVISNLPLPEVEAFLGERTFDRLREGGGRAESFEWGSYRSNRG